jgi:hypothetical protein
VPLYQSDRANESVLIMKLGCTISLKAAVLPGHQLTGLVKKKKKKKYLSMLEKECFWKICLYEEPYFPVDPQ